VCIPVPSAKVIGLALTIIVSIHAGLITPETSIFVHIAPRVTEVPEERAVNDDMQGILMF
jgi:hypothetical protein